ncbi:signal peptidase II [Rheinheimera pacifica]|uniref:Lipoprotein signal peptidase n=1 Tax=Rheinheimera pacifica TaxID=173990 RepID=A0A1H6JMQ5_9GAMM|nr:signal peptidase II [Rheinheimera pacifica]MDR6983245.1 signal peptidase II [Rheinheimera pacifica]PKM21174.1 MAG: lipoprotein signal peptidase [Gammaproteobacteria bacterium HGW-Gammaproteobacteria-15]SEH60575.1 signal peptidase II [Rheinheimera pacifica]
MALFKDTGWRLWWLMLLVLVADQVSKQVVIANMQLFDSIELLPFFNFTYVRNHGAAFSFLSDAGGWQRWFFTVIAVVISAVLAVWLARNSRAQLKLNLALSLVLAGAIGNLIDRSIYGYVIDFFHLYYQNWHYPAFNIADSAICIGAALLIWDSFSNNEVKK